MVKQKHDNQSLEGRNINEPPQLSQTPNGANYSGYGLIAAAFAPKLPAPTLPTTDDVITEIVQQAGWVSGNTFFFDWDNVSDWQDYYGYDAPEKQTKL